MYAGINHILSLELVSDLDVQLRVFVFKIFWCAETDIVIIVFLKCTSHQYRLFKKGSENFELLHFIVFQQDQSAFGSRDAIEKFVSFGCCHFVTTRA